MTRLPETGWQPSPTAGRWLVLTATLLWSLAGFFGAAPLFGDWPAGSRGTLIAFWRALFAAAVLWPFVRRPRWTPRLVPMAGCFVLMNVTLLSAMAFTSSANAIWLQFTAPIWVFFGSVFWIGERATKCDGFMTATCAVGIAVILAFSGGQDLRGVALGVASGITFGGVVLSLRLLRGEDPVWLIALNNSASALVLGGFVAWHGIWPDARQLGFLAAFGVLQIGIPYLLFTVGIRAITSNEASAITLLEPVLVPVWVWVAWSGHADYKPVHWSTFVGAALILTGVFVRFVPPRKAAPRS